MSSALLRPVLAATVLAVLATGCGPTGKAPAGSDSTSRPVIAVLRKGGGLELYDVGAGPAAHLLRSLRGPAGRAATEVTMSGGPRPIVCAAWSDAKGGLVECYAAGAEEGTVVLSENPTSYSDLALSTAGTSLAWTDDLRPGQPDVLYTRLTSTGHGPITRLPAYASSPDVDEATLGVGGIAWQDEGSLLVAHGYDDDVNGEVARVPLTGRPAAWTDAPLVAADEHWPVLFGLTSAAHDGKVLLLQEGFREPNGREVMRAVEIEIATGSATSVVSVPAADRRMASVSGGTRGVLYRTEGEAGVDRTYWRAPGRLHGLPLLGLPVDAVSVIAQP